VLLAAVVKVQVKLDDRGLPAASFALVEIVAVYCVLAVSAAEGTLLFDSSDSAGFPEVFRGIAWGRPDEAARLPSPT